MRRLAAIATVLAAAIVVVLGSGASSGRRPAYLVRAIFDNAAFAVAGEDVRIAGAPVGSIHSLDVTADKKAAVTLSISDFRFTPFHQNASCAIRPQSLIGEKYVDCNPGTTNAPVLPKIASGPGAGSSYLPVTQTSSPVDSDIVQDIYQLPIRQRFAIIIDEFGTGLAARGSDLNTVIHRANPSLGYTDQVFQILARQNRQLAQLASDSDTVLTPLAQDRSALAGFVVQANTTSVASAARAADISRSFQLFPSFLRQLRPLMVDLGNFADQGTGLMGDLSKAASGLNKEFTNLAPFATAARTSLIALGNASQQSQPALIASEPLAERLLRLGNATEPTAVLLDQLLSSLQSTGAYQQLMALLFNGTSATNGFDQIGHYARTESLVGDCTGYAQVPVSGCSAKFGGASASAAVARLFGNAAAANLLPSPAKVHPSTNAPKAANDTVNAPQPSPLAVQAVNQAQKSHAKHGSLDGLLRYLIGGGQ